MEAISSLQKFQEFLLAFASKHPQYTPVFLDFLKQFYVQIL